MPLKQAQVARELKLSRSVISDNVKAGMPLTSMQAVNKWRRANVEPRYFENGIAERNMLYKGNRIRAENNYGWQIEPREWALSILHINRFIREGWQEFAANPPAPGASPKKFSPAQLLCCWAICGMMDNEADLETAIARVQELIRPVYYHDGFDR